MRPACLLLIAALAAACAPAQRHTVHHVHQVVVVDRTEATPRITRVSQQRQARPIPRPAPRFQPRAPVPWQTTGSHRRAERRAPLRSSQEAEASPPAGIASRGRGEAGRATPKDGRELTAKDEAGATSRAGGDSESKPPRREEEDQAQGALPTRALRRVTRDTALAVFTPSGRNRAERWVHRRRPATPR